MRSPAKKTAASHYDDYENIVLRGAGGGEAVRQFCDRRKRGSLFTVISCGQEMRLIW